MNTRAHLRGAHAAHDEQRRAPNGRVGPAPSKQTGAPRKNPKTYPRAHTPIFISRKTLQRHGLPWSATDGSRRVVHALRAQNHAIPQKTNLLQPPGLTSRILSCNFCFD